MRYELTDHEWTTIKPMLPNKPRGVPRVNDRRVLNGIFWLLRSGAPWRDLPDDFGPYTTCYNRFVRWRRAGVWGRIMNALAAAHDASVQMIDTSIVRGLEAQQKAVRDYLNGGAWELVGEFVEVESNSPGPSRCSRVRFNAKTHDEIV